MVKFKDGSNYLEIGIFDALFLPERTLARKKAFIKRQKEAKSKTAEDGPAAPAAPTPAAPPADAPAAPAAEAGAAAQPGQPPSPQPEPAPAPPPAAVAPAAAPAAPVAEAAAPAHTPAPAPAEEPAGVAGIEVLAEVVRPAVAAAPAESTPAAPAAPPALPGKGEWNDAKIDKLCSMVDADKGWEAISTELGETVDDVLKKFSQLPEDKRKVLKLDSGDWNENLDEMLWALRQEQGKSWAFVSAAMLREAKDCQEKFKELKEKRGGGNKDGGNGGKSGKGGKGGGNNNNNGGGGGKDNAGGNKKGNEKEKADDSKSDEKKSEADKKPDEPESKPDASLPNGKFPRVSGDFIDEDNMSSYDPEGPPDLGPRGFVDRYDDSQPLKDEQGHLLGQDELDYLVKLAHYYDNQKWMDVASRFFDETGRRVPWGQLKQKLGNLKFP